MSASDVRLTRRETEVLTLIAAGFSAREVASRLSITPRTVERNIDRLRMKLAARNRTHMVACAMGAGLLRNQ